MQKKQLYGKYSNNLFIADESELEADNDITIKIHENR